MNDDEQRLRRLLAQSVPDLGDIDPQLVRARAHGHRRPRLALFGAIAAAAVVVAGIAVSVPLLRHAGSSGSPAAASIGHATKTATPGSTPRDGLAALTENVPCPRAVESGKKPAATRAELERFHAVAAFTCSDTEKTFPGDGEWTVEIRKATSTDISALIRAFDQPDQPAGSSSACAAIGIVWPPVLLVDSKGHYLSPPMPADRCHLPLRTVTQAVNGLSWHTLSEHKVGQQTSASGCITHVKNMPYLVSQSGSQPHNSNGGPVLTLHPDATLKVCIYRTLRSDLSVGTFLRSAQLGTAESIKLRGALTGAGPPIDASCPGQRDFATVTVEHGGTVYLELGGCWRLLRTDDGRSGLGTATSASTVENVLGMK